MAMGAGELVLDSLASAEALRHPWAWVHWCQVTTGIYPQLKYNGEYRDTTHTGVRCCIRPAVMGGNRCFKLVEVKGDEEGWKPSGGDSRHV